jgi:hypothetical protein
MFVQVFQGRASDADGLRHQLDRWDRDLKPGADGYLGATSGVADDGTFVSVVRFESVDAAQANSDRAEQGAWWSETETRFDGDVAFEDCNEVQTFLFGDPDDAGFVQVIRGRARDKARLKELDEEILEWFPAMRPDYLGSLRAWYGDRFTEVAYFTSEAEAREGERRLNESQQAAHFNEWLDLVDDVVFIDLKDPWLYS